jgi:hypothetical protein
MMRMMRRDSAVIFYGLDSFGVRSYFFFDDHFHFFTAVLTFKSAQLSL